MRLFLIGATGKTGRQILDLALDRGHEVTAFVRSPQKLQSLSTLRAGSEHDGTLRPAGTLTIVHGEVKDREAVAAAVRGHDAVLSAIGHGPPHALRPSTLMADSASSTVDAMRSAGVTRLAIVSAAVLFPMKGIQFAFFRWLLKHHARDLRAMEHVVRASGLDWTIARPPRLTKSPEVRFRALSNGLPPGGLSMSFRSVAAFMLDAVEQRTYSHEVVGLGR